LALTEKKPERGFTLSGFQRHEMVAWKVRILVKLVYVFFFTSSIQVFTLCELIPVLPKLVLIYIHSRRRGRATRPLAEEVNSNIIVSRRSQLMTPSSLGFGDVEDSEGSLAVGGFFNFAPVCSNRFSLARPYKRITRRSIIVTDPCYKDKGGILEICAIYNSWPDSCGSWEERCHPTRRFCFRCVRL
jgi:hypothetical protein